MSDSARAWVRWAVGALLITVAAAALLALLLTSTRRDASDGVRAASLAWAGGTFAWTAWSVRRVGWRPALAVGVAVLLLSFAAVALAPWLGGLLAGGG